MCSKPNATDQNRPLTSPPVDDIIKAHVGTECDQLVLASLEKEVESGPEEPPAVVKDNGIMTKI